VQHTAELHAHATRILKDKARAEEITQEALIKFMLAAPELLSDAHALSYLHRTIENLCIDLFRAESRRPNLVSIDDAVAEIETAWQVSGDHSTQISEAEDAAIIRQALALLSPAERTALIMWEVEGRSTTEIAKSLGVKESSVRHTLSRARASFRKILSEYIIDQSRGLTALDLLSTSYRKSAKFVSNSSKIALTILMVVVAYLGFKLPPAGESETSPSMETPAFSRSQEFNVNDGAVGKSLDSDSEGLVVENYIDSNSVNTANSESLDNLDLSLAQLETLTLMISVIDSLGGSSAPNN
jgi:RNA polymerase sigma factor (sigma-70 family)